MEQLIAHLFGDYIFQTDYMAEQKTKSLWIALAHAFTYAWPFLLLTNSGAALSVIVVSHALIDRFRVARFLVWFKNQSGPASYRYPLADAGWHGYKSSKPEWLAGWLYIIADNALHLLFNYSALRWL